MTARALGCLTLLAISLAAPSRATELVGRIVDNSEAQVFVNAEVRIQGATGASPQAVADTQGFFSIADVRPGAYVLDITLPDGRAFTTRLLVPGRYNKQYLELDYSRAVSPADDDDY